LENRNPEKGKIVDQNYNTNIDIKDHTMDLRYRGTARLVIKTTYLSLITRFKMVPYHGLRILWSAGITIELVHPSQPNRTANLFVGDEYTLGHTMNFSANVLRASDGNQTVPLNKLHFPFKISYEGRAYSVESERSVDVSRQKISDRLQLREI